MNEGSGFNAITDGGTYFGSSTSDLQIFNTVRTMNGYIYHVVVSGCGTDVQSPDATLTINTAPELTKHPSDSTVCLGNNATMEADATPAGLLHGSGLSIRVPVLYRLPLMQTSAVKQQIPLQ